MANVKTLSGYVVNSTGGGLASKTVTLKNASSGATVTTTTTDSDGLWSFANQDESIAYKVEVAVGGSSTQKYVRLPAGAEFSHVYATTSLRTGSSATVAIGGAMSVAGALTVSTGGAAITGATTVTGALTVSSTLAAQAAATVGTTLTVTGAATFNGGLTATVTGANAGVFQSSSTGDVAVLRVVGTSGSGGTGIGVDVRREGSNAQAVRYRLANVAYNKGWDWTMAASSDDLTLSNIGTGSALVVKDSTRQVLLSTDGSESAPVLAWEGDTNTGIYRVSADWMSFVAGGTTAMYARFTGGNAAVSITQLMPSLIADTSAPPATVIYKMPVYSAPGTIAGYVPVYTDI